MANKVRDSVKHPCSRTRGTLPLLTFLCVVRCMFFLRTILFFSAHPNCASVPHTLPVLSLSLTLSLPFLPRPPFFLLLVPSPSSLFLHFTSHHIASSPTPSSLHVILVLLLVILSSAIFAAQPMPLSLLACMLRPYSFIHS